MNDEIYKSFEDWLGKRKDNRMRFTAIGSKASPHTSHITEVDLLTDTKQSIRRRQRKITSMHISSYENKSDDGKRYSKSEITIHPIFAN